MIYAYDKGVQLPITDLYDTQMRLAYISAAKDMYEKAEQEMKDFKKEYGDFYSSRPSDMEWYAGEYGKIQNLINNYYEQGINPLRSPEARAEINRAVNNFDYAQFAERKKSAAVYDEYLKNQARLAEKNLYNPQFEEYMMKKDGVSLDDRIWNRISPTPYLGEEALTDDIFSGIKPEYIGTDKNGMDWRGVTPERRKEALDAQLDNILTTPSGQFIEDQVKASLGPNASAEDIRNGVLDRIVQATGKWDYKDFSENPVAKRQAELRDKIALENLHYKHQQNLYDRRHGDKDSSSGKKSGGKSTEKDDLGMKSHITNSGLSMLAGTQDFTKYGISIKPNMRNIFNTAFLQNGVPKSTESSKAESSAGDGKPIYAGKTVVPNSTQWNNIKNKVLGCLKFNGYNRADFPQVVNRSPSTDSSEAAAGMVVLSSSDLPYIQGENDIFSHMYGGFGLTKFTSDPIRNQLKEYIDEGDKVLKMVPTGNVIPVYDNKGVISMKHEIKIIDTSNNETIYDKLYLTENSRSPENEDKLTVGSLTKPVIYLDAREQDANAVRQSSIALDKKYGASINAEAETPASGTWTGYYQPVQPIDDDWFFNTFVNE